MTTLNQTAVNPEKLKKLGKYIITIEFQHSDQIYPEMTDDKLAGHLSVAYTKIPVTVRELNSGLTEYNYNKFVPADANEHDVYCISETLKSAKYIFYQKMRFRNVKH